MNIKNVTLLFFLTITFCIKGDSVWPEDTIGNYTSLMKAIEEGESPVVISQLIEQGEDVNAIDSECIRWLKPVLRYALDRGTDKPSIEIIKMLIAAGADVNEVTYNRVTDEKVYGMMPLLTYACIYSSAEIVQLLVNAGSIDTILPNNGITFNKSALTIAKELEKTDIIHVLEKKN